MKIDPHKHKERCFAWKEKIKGRILRKWGFLSIYVVKDINYIDNNYIIY